MSISLSLFEVSEHVSTYRDLVKCRTPNTVIAFYIYTALFAERITMRWNIVNLSVLKTIDTNIALKLVLTLLTCFGLYQNQQLCGRRFLKHDAEHLIFWLCRGTVTLLTISNLVIISEKNTTKDNKKKTLALRKMILKKEFCAKYRFLFTAFIWTFKRNYLHIDLFIMISRYSYLRRL